MCPPPSPSLARPPSPTGLISFSLELFLSWPPRLSSFRYQLAWSQLLHGSVVCHRNHVVNCGNLGIPGMAQFQPSVRGSLLPEGEPQSHRVKLSAIFTSYLEVHTGPWFCWSWVLNR